MMLDRIIEFTLLKKKKGFLNYFDWHSELI